MVEKIGHIKNPLTVIAIFAAIAEISGAGVLPFIESHNQSAYVWFLMIFPIFLVGIFFLTLNLNHKVLYAPSDYQDEDNFLRLLGKVTAEEKEEKLREEVEEASEVGEAPDEEPEISAESGEETAPENGTAEDALTLVPQISEVEGVKLKISNFSKKKFSEFMAKYHLAENLSINRLAKELCVDFKRDVSFEVSNKRKILFDGVATKNGKIHAVETKLFKNQYISAARFDKALLESELLTSQLNNIDGKDFVLHLFVVLESEAVNVDIVKSKLSKYASKFNVNVEIHVSTLSDLSDEVQYSL